MKTTQMMILFLTAALAWCLFCSIPAPGFAQTETADYLSDSTGASELVPVEEELEGEGERIADEEVQESEGGEVADEEGQESEGGEVADEEGQEANEAPESDEPPATEE